MRSAAENSPTGPEQLPSMPSVKRQAAFTLLAEVLSFVVAILVSVIINRALQPIGRGNLASLVNTIGIAFAVASFSLSKSFLYFFNRDDVDRRKVVAAAVSLMPIGTLLGLGVLFGVGYTLFDSVTVVIAASVWLLLHQVQDVTIGALRAVRVIHVLNVSRVVNQLVRLGLALFLAWFANLTFPNAVLMEMAALAVSLVILGVALWRRPELHPSFGRHLALASQMLKYGITYQAFSLLWTLHLKLDVVLLKTLDGTVGAGLYATAVNLADMITRVPTMLLFVVSPYIAQIKSERDSLAYAARMCRLTLPLIAVVALALGLVAGFIVPFLYGPKFAGAVTPLRLLLPGTCLINVFMLLNSFLLVRGVLKPMLVLHGLGLATNLTLNVLLIPEFGPSGASLASVGSYAMLTVLTIALMVRRHGLKMADLVRYTPEDRMLYRRMLKPIAVLERLRRR